MKVPAFCWGHPDLVYMHVPRAQWRVTFSHGGQYAYCNECVADLLHDLGEDDLITLVKLS